MLPLVFLCLAATCLAQQSTTQYSTSTSQIESEEDNANTQSAVYPLPQVNYNSYQPAAQQRRPIYTAPRAPEVYSYMPYSFNYVAQGEDGSSSRQETADGNGRVVGSYTIAVEDGRRRVVDYVADQNGFRATIDTNEPGTDVQNPADVVFHSAAIDSRSNQAGGGVYRPQTSYRQRPSRIYTQPAVLSPVVYRAETHAPYYQYDHHGHDQHNRHNTGHSYASYYDNNSRYHWH